MKSESNFTMRGIVNRNELPEEALEIIAYGDVRLGEGKNVEAADEAKQQLLEQVKAV